MGRVALGRQRFVLNLLALAMSACRHLILAKSVTVVYAENVLKTALVVKHALIIVNSMLLPDCLQVSCIFLQLILLPILLT